MEFSGQMLWGIIGGIAGAALVSIIFLLVILPKRKKPLPEIPAIKEKEEEIKVEVLPPAHFEITDLLVTPSQVKEGEEVTVLVQVNNTGGSAGKHDVTLSVDKRVVGIKEVNLEPGSTTLVNFTVKETAGGEHIVEVEGFQAKFIVPPAKFSLSHLTIIPDHVREHERVTISVKVANDGGATGSYLAELKIRGTTEMAQEIMLPPGMSQTISFTTAKKNAGFYPIEIGNLSGRIIVEMADFFERI